MLNYGADPEVFSCINIDNKEYVISPALLEVDGQITPVKNDKKHPVYIDKEDFSWMMDGVAWEITLKKPLENAVELYNVCQNSLDSLSNFLNKLSWEGSKLELVKKPVVNINPEIYIKLMQIDKVYQGFIFGCDKDEDAIETSYECETINVLTHLLRYGGGHLHFSGIEDYYKYPRPAIQLFSIFVGNFLIINSPYLNLDKQRSLTYGRPGRFRRQIYKDGTKGIEYRTPSNSWLSFSQDKVEEMIYMANKATEVLQEPPIAIELIKEYLPKTIDSIINADVSLASNILQEIL